MAGNKNSGRRTRKEEDRKNLSRLYPTAISVLEEILEDAKAPYHVRLDAAREVIHQQIGRPTQAIEADIGPSGEAVEYLDRLCALRDRKVDADGQPIPDYD